MKRTKKQRMKSLPNYVYGRFRVYLWGLHEKVLKDRVVMGRMESLRPEYPRTPEGCAELFVRLIVDTCDDRIESNPELWDYMFFWYRKEFLPKWLIYKDVGRKKGVKYGKSV